MDDIPQWASNRAFALINAGPHCGPGWAERFAAVGATNAFARYIAENEKPPVDALEAETDALLDEVYRVTGWCERDMVLRALRRGIELGKQL